MEIAKIDSGSGHERCHWARERCLAMELRGIVIQNRKKFVEDNFGQDAWQKVLDNLPQVNKRDCMRWGSAGPMTE
jgi:hypothetical protein